MTSSAIGRMASSPRSRWRMVLLAGAALTLSAGVGRAWAVVNPVTIDTVGQYIEEAKTAADHEALAAFFKGEVAKQQEKIKQHEAMLKSYAKAPGKAGEEARHHCQTLIKLFQEQAQMYAAMAADHEKMAKELVAKK